MNNEIYNKMRIARNRWYGAIKKRIKAEPITSLDLIEAYESGWKTRDRQAKKELDDITVIYSFL